jgi:23S rRNA pseudouridine2457 synthase
MATILFNKPYGVICQFSREGDRSTLADFGPFPKDVYPAGRLDTDSEGLVLLTNDGTLQHRLTDPLFGHQRTYFVQVERIPAEEALENLRKGVLIDGKKTRPARVRLLDGELELPSRPVPVRYRKNVPTCWMELIISEGRNRQVRKMTAAVGHPTLRLVRVAIGPLRIGGLAPGEWRTLGPAALQVVSTHHPRRPAGGGSPGAPEPQMARSRRRGRA